MQFSCFISTKLISKIFFFHLLVMNILTNISKSNSNYLIYMHITMAVKCGVDICTSPQSAFQYNYILIFNILIQFSSFIYQLQIFQESISFFCWSVLTDIFPTNSNPYIHMFMCIAIVHGFAKKGNHTIRIQEKTSRRIK